jgi:hypothetical protein
LYFSRQRYCYLIIDSLIYKFNNFNNNCWLQATGSCQRTRALRGGARKRVSSSSAPRPRPSLPWAPSAAPSCSCGILTLFLGLLRWCRVSCVWCIVCRVVCAVCACV